MGPRGIGSENSQPTVQLLTARATRRAETLVHGLASPLGVSTKPPHALFSSRFGRLSILARMRLCVAARAETSSLEPVCEPRVVSTVSLAVGLLSRRCIVARRAPAVAVVATLFWSRTFNRRGPAGHDPSGGETGKLSQPA